MEFEYEYESGETANDQTTSLSWSSSGSLIRVWVNDTDSGCLMSPRKRRVEEEEELLLDMAVDRLSANNSSMLVKNSFSSSCFFLVYNVF